MKIRRSEWDYSWLIDSLAREVSLCRCYEYARYALLSAAPEPSFIFPQTLPAGALPHLFAAKQILGPIFTLASYLPAKVTFPQLPYRQARELFPGPPQILETLIQDFRDAAFPSYEKLEFYVRIGALAQAQELIAQLKATPPAPRPKRGAGARIRQERTDLKCLGALKLLEAMNALRASCHTEEALGKALFGKESEWSRARARAERTLAPYREEAALLLQALDEKRELESFSYYSGKPQID
jgi:hypothetical protein